MHIKFFNDARLYRQAQYPRVTEAVKKESTYLEAWNAEVVHVAYFGNNM